MGGGVDGELLFDLGLELERVSELRLLEQEYHPAPEGCVCGAGGMRVRLDRVQTGSDGIEWDGMGGGWDG